MEVFILQLYKAFFSFFLFFIFYFFFIFIYLFIFFLNFLLCYVTPVVAVNLIVNL